MLKYRNAELVLGALFATALWTGIWGWHDSYTPTEKQKDECYDTAKKTGQKSDECKLFWERTTSDPVAFFLWVATIFLYGAGEKQIAVAKDSADAAKMAANAALATERAKFYIVIKKHNFEEFLNQAGRYPNSPTMPYSFEPSIEYTFKNYGKTPGIVREVSEGLIVNAGPPDPVYQVTRHLFSEYMIAAGDSTEPQQFDSPALFRNIENSFPILQGQAHFWFYGRFDYVDVFGNPQVHRFLMRYIKIGREWGFQPYEHKHYNQST